MAGSGQTDNLHGVQGFAQSTSGTGLSGGATGSTGKAVWSICNGSCPGTAGYAGYFQGDVTVTGVPRANQSSFTLLSDARLKKNVQPLTGSLDKLLGPDSATPPWGWPP